MYMYNTRSKTYSREMYKIYNTTYGHGHAVQPIRSNQSWSNYAIIQFMN